MKVLRNLSWTCVPALFAVMVIMSGALMSPAAMAQDEKAVENCPYRPTTSGSKTGNMYNRH